MINPALVSQPAIEIFSEQPEEINTIKLNTANTDLLTEAGDLDEKIRNLHARIGQAIDKLNTIIINP